MIATHGQFQAAKLWQRLDYARQHLTPVQTDLRIMFEDPLHPDEPAKQVVPSPNWLAAALHGNILPSIDAYLKMPLKHRYERNGVVVERQVLGANAAMLRWRMQEEGWQFTREDVMPGHILHTADVMPPMTLKEAMEYLLQKDVPSHVWSGGARSNKKMFVFCKADQLPGRAFRNAWEIIQ